jgi:hypothetical protein
MTTIVRLVLAGALLGGCSPQPLAPSDGTSELQSHVVAGRVDFAEAFPFAWDKAFVLGSYQSAETIQNTICLDWDLASVAADFTKADPGYVVVLVGSGQVQRWYPLNSEEDARPVSFEAETDFYVLHSEARFEVLPAEFGSLLLVPETPKNPERCAAA